MEEPTPELAEPHELLPAYLDWYRATVVRKLDGLDEQAAHTSLLPSEWTPAQLLNHLTYMERRWFEWGFTGIPVTDPWGDGAGVWHVAEEDTLTALLERFHARCARSRELVTDHALTDHATPGGRFPAGSTLPTLAWIFCHVLQEYARHTGHLDIVRELTDGATGE